MRSCFKYYGGKHFLKGQIIELMPSHTTYIEPFFGGGQVFFAKPPAPREIINDINAPLMNMWTHIKEKPDALIALLKGVPYSETSFRNALVESPAPRVLASAVVCPTTNRRGTAPWN